MSESTEEDYGPLKGLIGIWKGDKGLDVAPDPEGTENNPYYETINYEACGDVSNAETQVLSVIHYRQIVKRKADNKVFHDQTGYWMWDPERLLVMHSLTIPRAVCVLAGGKYEGGLSVEGDVLIEVAAHVGDENWSIIQSPFMAENARTTAFNQGIIVGDDKLSYAQAMMVDIYGKTFEHTDQNELERLS